MRARGFTYAVSGVLALFILLPACGEESARQADSEAGHPAWRQGYSYHLAFHAPFERELLVLTQEGREAARYRLSDCGLTSSETGIFPFLDEIGEEPVIAVLCGTWENMRSFYLFAPATDPEAPAFALESKPSLGISIYLGGISASWMTPDGLETVFWEPSPNSFGLPRFRNARFKAMNLSVTPGGTLPPGLEPADYRAALDPDTPLRLGPSQNAPWFFRLGEGILLHTPVEREDIRPLWRIGGWLRVCLTSGPCGYVPESAVIQPAAAPARED